MNINEILAHLKSERDRLDQAIAALNGVSTRRTGRKTAAAAPRGRRRGSKRRMSASARNRLSQMLKKRWAERKKQGKAKL